MEPGDVCRDLGAAGAVVAVVVAAFAAVGLTALLLVDPGPGSAAATGGGTAGVGRAAGQRPLDGAAAAHPAGGRVAFTSPDGAAPAGVPAAGTPSPSGAGGGAPSGAGPAGPAPAAPSPGCPLPLPATGPFAALGSLLGTGLDGC